MDETIGVKGGQNDRRRVLKISENQLNKLKKHKEEIVKNLLVAEEKKLRENQIATAVVAVPLVLTASIVKELTTPKKEEITIENKTSTTVANDMSTIQVKITTNNYKKRPSANQKEAVTETKSLVEASSKEQVYQQVSLQVEEQLEKLKDREIITRYETKLKEIKSSLQQLIYEYNLIVYEYDDLYDSKKAEELLNKLTLIIKKLEALKRLIAIPNKEDFDQEYITNLINSYMSELKNEELLEEIKDSELYKLIESKIIELDNKKDSLQEKLATRKEELELDEEKITEIKEKYEKLDNFNNELLKFQADQEALSRTLTQNIQNAVTERDRVEVNVRFLYNVNNAINNIIAPQLLIPGANSAARIAFATISLAHIMRNHLRPRIETRHYHIIDVTDYMKDITNSIDDIEKSLRVVKRSKKHLEEVITEFKEKYKDYIKELKECQELLDNLENLLETLTEKEEELNRLKIEQEKNLENNNARVLELRRETN